MPVLRQRTYRSGVKSVRPTIPNQRFFDNEPFGELFDWQTDWLGAFDDGLARRSMCEIHRRGRKTSTLINLQIRECCRMRNCRYVYLGPTFAEARRIVWDDPSMLRESLPNPRAEPWKMNQSNFTITFPRTGCIWQMLGSEQWESLRGIDFQGIGYDEWSQQQVEAWQVVQPVFEQDPSRWAAFLYTPNGLNHATQMFDHAAYVDEGDSLPDNGRAARCRDGWYAARLIADKSGIFTPAALVEAENDPMMTPEMFQQEYQCARVMDEQFTLITTAMIDGLRRESPGLAVEPAVIACDPSMGGDACTIDAHQGHKCLFHESIRSRDQRVIAGELMVVSNRTGILDFIIDGIGIGQAAIAILSDFKQYHVMSFIGSEAASDPVRFGNKRAEMYWHAMQEVRKGEVEYPKDEETRRQLPFASRYKPTGGKINILKKEDIRKLLGRSPDDAESWVLARWGLRNARQCSGRMMDHIVEVPAGRDRGYRPSDPMSWIEPGRN